MVGKYEVSHLIQNFCIMVKTQFDTCVKVLRSDNGPEFILKQFYAKHGILH